MGEKELDKDNSSRSPGRRALGSGLTARDSEGNKGDENWLDGDDRRRDSRDEDRRGGGGTVNARFEDKDITDLKMVSVVICMFFAV